VGDIERKEEKCRSCSIIGIRTSQGQVKIV